MRQILSSLLVLCCATPLAAQEETRPLPGEARFMVGAALSLDNASIESFVRDDFADRGQVVSTDADRFTLGRDLYMGIDLDGVINLRLGAREFDDQQADVSPAAYSGGGPSGEATVSVSGRYGALDVLFPVMGIAELGVSAGLYDWHGEQTAVTDSSVRSRRIGGTDPFYGLKARRIIGDLAVQLSLTRYKLAADGDSDLDIVAAGAGVEYRF